MSEFFKTEESKQAVRAHLLTLVCLACKEIGMTHDQVAYMFRKSNVKKAYEILKDTKFGG